MSNYCECCGNYTDFDPVSKTYVDYLFGEAGIFDEHIATEKTRAMGVESGLDTRLTTAESEIDDLQKSKYGLNVLTLGVKNDGTTDCSTIINQYMTDNPTDETPLYFPAGEYLVNSTIDAHCSIIGEGYARGTDNGDNCTCFVQGATLPSKVINVTTVCRSGNFKDFDIRMVGAGHGLYINMGTYQHHNIDHVSVHNMYSGNAIHCTSSAVNSRAVYISDVYVLGGLDNSGTYHALTGTVQGIYLNNCHDASLCNIEVMHCTVGVNVGNSSLTKIIGAHIYCGGTPTASQVTSTMGIKLQGDNVDIKCTNIYIDTCYEAIVAHGDNCNVTVDGFTYFDDGTMASSGYSAGSLVACSSYDEPLNCEINNASIRWPSHWNKVAYSPSTMFSGQLKLWDSTWRKGTMFNRDRCRASMNLVYGETGKWIPVALIFPRTGCSSDVYTVRTAHDTYTGAEVVCTLNYSVSTAGVITMNSATSTYTAFGSDNNHTVGYRIISGAIVLFVKDVLDELNTLAHVDVYGTGRATLYGGYELWTDDNGAFGTQRFATSDVTEITTT